MKIFNIAKNTLALAVVFVLIFGAGNIVRYFTKEESDARYYAKTQADTTFVKVADLVTPTEFDTLNITNKLTAPTKGLGTSTTDVTTMAALQNESNDLSSGLLYEQIKAIGNVHSGRQFKYFPALTTNNVGTQVTLVDGRFYRMLFVIFKTDTVTGVEWQQSTQGNYNANQYNGFKLYSLNTTTNVTTVIDSTLNDGNLWKVASFSPGYKAFTSQRILTPGVYVVAAIWNTSDGSPAAAPQVYNHTTVTGARWYLNGVLNPTTYVANINYLPDTFDYDTDSNTASTTAPGIWLYK